MTGQASRDRLINITNDAGEARRGGEDPVPAVLGIDPGFADRDQDSADADQTASVSDQAAADSDQAAADSDQAASDSDQAAADSDQAASDSDQAAADSDQAASDSDQAAADTAQAPGPGPPAAGDMGVHKFTRELRERSTGKRDETALQRAEAAAARDEVARARDAAAQARDRAADVRDRRLAARDDTSEGDGLERRRAARRRRSAAADRAAAAEIRVQAAADREQAARDRDQAARDREQAQADRQALLHQLAIAETDALTGARSRAAGLVDLEHEIDRSHRTGTPLVAAYVDVVGLKAVNDTHGHRAGDELLRSAVTGIREHLRPYDLIVRLGGDEFLCVMSGATIQEGRQRFAAVGTALATQPKPCAIKIGFAALTPGDSAADLIERADAELPASPGR